jgi:hypothetical protein
LIKVLISDTTFCHLYDQKREVALQDLLVYDKKKLGGVTGKDESSKKGN